jgi:hypothetical protein
VDFSPEAVHIRPGLQIWDEQAAVERLAFERAIIKIEGDARKTDMRKQSRDKHRRPFTAFLSFLSAH